MNPVGSGLFRIATRNTTSRPLCISVNPEPPPSSFLRSCRGIAFACLVVVCLGGCATVKTKDEMTTRDIRALEESQGRINAYRERLHALKKDRAAKTLGEDELDTATDELNGLVEKEIALQKAIIRKDKDLATKAGNLLVDIGKVALYSVVAVGALAVETLKGIVQEGGSFEP